jgi:small-conductance mechanosensitive channel
MLCANLVQEKLVPMHTIRRILIQDPWQLIMPLVTFGLVFGIGWLIRRVVLRALRAWTERSNSRPGLILSEALHGPTQIWILILALHLSLQSSELPLRYTNWAAKGLLVLWILSLTYMFMRAAGNLVRFYGDQVPTALPVTTLTQNLAQLAVAILGTVVLLRSVGLEITPILTALGVGGLAVALALQDTLSNLFSGFYVAVAGQIRLGDYIKLNTGEEGYVTDIGWRSTTLRALANNMILIPNSKLAQAIVTNYHLPEKRMGTNLQVSVSYDADPDHIERVLLEVVRQAANEVPGLLVEPPPSVVFDPGFGESALAFTLNFQIAEFSNQGRVRHELRKRILLRFRAEKINMPYPTRTVLVRENRAL